MEPTWCLVAILGFIENPHSCRSFSISDWKDQSDVEYLNVSEAFLIAENIFPNPSRFRALGLVDRDGRTRFVCRPPNYGFITLGASTDELMVSVP